MKVALLGTGSGRGLARDSLKALARVANEHTVVDPDPNSISKIARIKDMLAVVGVRWENSEDKCDSAKTAPRNAAGANFTMREDLPVRKAFLGRRGRDGRFEKGNLSAVDRAYTFLHVSVLRRSQIDFEQGLEKAKSLI